MSTNATISVVHHDGSVNTIYLHWDGYPEHALTMLECHYGTYNKVANLVSLGDLSSLYENATCPVGHSFATPISGCCVAYGRDRGEDGIAPRAYNNIEAYTERAEVQQYNYLFNNGKWEQS